MTATELRDASIVREEVADLMAYLNGLPEEMRDTGAFLAYEQRVGELSRELVLADMAAALPTEDTGRNFRGLVDELAGRSRGYEHSVQWREGSAIAISLLNFGTAVVSFYFDAPGRTLGVLAILSGLACLGWLHARRRAHKASRLTALREEISHSFGPSGEILRPSEYYSASVKRVETLVDAITEDSDGHARKR